MGECTDVDGARFSEDDIDRWAAEAESDRGYTGGHLGPSRPGPPGGAGRGPRTSPSVTDVTAHIRQS